jgi:hypothetical protein
VQIIDVALRVLTLFALLGAFFLRDSVEWALVCGLLFAVGLWSVLFPSGVIGWAKVAHPELNPSDEAIWWVPRMIGGLFIAISLVLIAMSFSSDFVKSW